MELEYILLFVALIGIAIWIWRRNAEKLKKPRERWQQFGKRRKEPRSNGADDASKRRGSAGKRS